MIKWSPLLLPLGLIKPLCLHSFLTVTRPVDANVMVMEGRIPTMIPISHGGTEQCKFQLMTTYTSPEGRRRIESCTASPWSPHPLRKSGCCSLIWTVLKKISGSDPILSIGIYSVYSGKSEKGKGYFSCVNRDVCGCVAVKVVHENKLQSNAMHYNERNPSCCYPQKKSPWH